MSDDLRRAIELGLAAQGSLVARDAEIADLKRQLESWQQVAAREQGRADRLEAELRDTRELARGRELAHERVRSERDEARDEAARMYAAWLAALADGVADRDRLRAAPEKANRAISAPLSAQERLSEVRKIIDDAALAPPVDAKPECTCPDDFLSRCGMPAHDCPEHGANRTCGHGVDLNERCRACNPGVKPALAKCATCGDTGWVVAELGSVPCSACGGTGEAGGR